jgi:ribosomal protein S18 acetylase RimI-like enzyme
VDLIPTISTTEAIKFELIDEGVQLARATGVVVHNELHDKPYILLEDVFVREGHKGHGYGQILVKAVIASARKRGCYKVILNCRADNADLVGWYEKSFGFRVHPDLAMRLDLA